MIKSILTLAFGLLLILKGNAQLDDTSALYKTILKQDSILFTVGFNTCDLKTFENTLSLDFADNKKIEEWLKELNIPTVGIGVIKAGKLQEVKVYGELKKGIVAPYNTLFNVASLTKPITATVALILVSQGKWNLDDPIYKYWIDPDIAIDSNLKKLTTRHILTHQTGFTNWRGNSKDGKLHFEFAPGTKYQYSGEGFEYLRKALEQKFKQPLNQLATDLVFTKLGMSDTKYYWDNHTDSSRFAIGYNTQGSPYKTIKNKTANGADDLLTTIEDYGNFLVSILKGNHLTKQLMDEMVSFQVKTKKDKFFGLGFEIYDMGNKEYAISHGGSDMGCNTIFFILPKTKEGLVIFTNVDDGYKIYEKLLTQYLPKYASKIIEIETK